MPYKTRINEVGNKYNLLTIKEFYDLDKWGQARWKCLCDCGRISIVPGGSLRKGYTKSCGCQQSKFIADSKRKHGMSNTTEYDIWSGMIRRCVNSRDKAYPNYGGRGISVFSEWLDRTTGFPKFLKCVGLRPSKEYTLDRIDNNGNYEPGNLRWASRKEQQANRRIKRIENFSSKEFEKEAQRRGLSLIPILEANIRNFENWQRSA